MQYNLRDKCVQKDEQTSVSTSNECLDQSLFYKKWYLEDSVLKPICCQDNNLD